MNLTVNKLKDVITGTIGSHKYSITFNQEIYNQLIALETELETAKTVEEANAILVRAKDLTSEKISDTLVSKFDYLVYNTTSNQYFIKSKNKVSSHPIPKALVDKILKAQEEGLPVEPLLKAWTWFLRNPKFSTQKAEYFAKYITTTVVDTVEKAKLMKEGYSDEVATRLATYNDVSITKNGLLSTYKYATIKDWKYDEHGKVIERYKKVFNEETGEYTQPDKPIVGETPLEDWYLLPPVMRESGEACLVSGEEKPTHRVKVGAVHSLPSWDSVNCNDGSWAVKGLHLGGLTYIQGYGGKTELLLNCFVNPMHIGAFDHSGNGAVRVLEYYVHSANFAPNKNLYHESEYAKRNEEQWATLRDEALKNSEELIKKIKDKQEEISAF